MVVTRKSSMIPSSVKEVVSTRVPRPLTRRIAELPSLRYGSIGARSPSGPLRVTAYYHAETLPKNSVKKTSKNGRFAEDDTYNKPVRPPRRVRFTLPSTDDDSDAVSTATTRPDVSRLSDARSRTVSSNPDAAVYSRLQPADILDTGIPVTSSPGVKNRVHPTGRYIRGTLSPTSNVAPLAAATPGGQALLRAARDGDDAHLKDLVRRALLTGISETDLNAADNSGRTALSYIAANGPVEILEQILLLPGLDPNKPDNEGNTPLHFVAQAGQVECLNCLLSKCREIHLDARNNLGFTPLMKAALQGRNKCAKILLFAGANPTLRDNGRGFRADQWARFCGRYICADVIEKHARARLLERSTSYGGWGGENDMGTRVLLGKVVPIPQIPPQSASGLRSKLRRVFRTSSSSANADNLSSARLVTQLTSAALCASTPVLPTASAPPVVKSLIRPLTVPRLQITLANSNINLVDPSLNGVSKTETPIEQAANPPVIKPARTKKKK